MFGKRKKADKPPVRDNEVTVLITRELESGLWVDTAVASHIGTREYQQDAAYVCEPLAQDGTAFGILCDGMGGMEAGELVSSDVVAFCANRIAALSPEEDVADFYEQTILDANELVLDRYVREGRESGTTLVSAIMRGGRLHWASVGDSRIYILRGGEIARVTRDHNFALQLQELVEAGRLSQQEADADPRREALVSYIGAPVLEMVDVSRGLFALEKDDLVLLCSDGLTKSLSDERILQLLEPPPHSLEEAARRLTLTAFDETPGGQDNTSVILMRYLGGAAKPPQHIDEANTQPKE